MDLWLNPAQCRVVLALASATLLTITLAPAPASAAPGVVAPGFVAAPAAVPGVQTPEQDRLREREKQALADLADSSQVVQAAAAALQSVAQQLPRARADVARARGELAGARAKAAAARAAVVRAEQARAAARAKVTQASEKVEQGRDDVGQLARRTYQRGRLGDLREVMDAGEPQDVLDRAGLLRSVFRYQDASLQRLTRARRSLARTQAGLVAEQRAVTRARVRAEQGEARAREVTLETEQAARRVAQLVAQRADVLRSAESHRAADVADYAAAQRASQELAERIREAARRAAAAEAARKAAEARRLAAERAAERAAAAADARRAAEARKAGKPAPARKARPSRGRSAPPPSRTGDMRWPCDGCPLTSRYGWRSHPIFGDRRFHAGIDMGAPMGTSVRASDAGTVIYAGYASGYGTLVVVSHGLVGGRDLSSAYAHMSSIDVSEGQRVDRGDRVGGVGNLGNSTGPHLHFEVRRDGEPVDPLDYVDPP